ncbi:Oidioi.mRNA.OKI2018_I69.YSR.g17072.t1.cds [Oikopleura dioica]|uniref:Oidioi.mRNA.OKI2018_I69.YSR.g17072.t1.cds n=1 Tax=Oikopleura dioica TaxID=34765 RepID=A0ABN7SN87_OIKDI|nr:Oidioi.mRNA.OKI2018_I69.YSR.g17072.t1.cds [Oikopleura dioica]
MVKKINSRDNPLNWNKSESREDWLKHAWDSWRGKGAEDRSISGFLDTFTLYNPSRPVLWKTMAASMERFWEKIEGRALLQDEKQIIAKWGSSRSRAQSNEDLYEPTQAPAFARSEMVPFWETAYNSGQINKKVGAAVSYICFCTGARTGEIVNLFIEDIRWKEDSGTVFLQMPLRSSKSNSTKERREVITLPITDNSEIDIKSWILEAIASRTKGKLFSYSHGKRKTTMNTTKMNYFYHTVSECLGWAVCPTGHSMRVSFVVESLKNGVPDQHIINLCRWKNEFMLNQYKNNQLEHTIHGSAFKVISTNERAHAKITHGEN